MTFHMKPNAIHTDHLGYLIDAEKIAVIDAPTTSHLLALSELLPRELDEARKLGVRRL